MSIKILDNLVKTSASLREIFEQRPALALEIAARFYDILYYHLLKAPKSIAVPDLEVYRKTGSTRVVLKLPDNDSQEILLEIVSRTQLTPFNDRECDITALEFLFDAYSEKVNSNYATQTISAVGSLLVMLDEDECTHLVEVTAPAELSVAFTYQSEDGYEEIDVIVHYDIFAKELHALSPEETE